MSKNKNHKCQCEHENVSYCKTCKVCHCADCNQEWRANPTTWAYQYPHWYGNSVSPTISVGGADLGIYNGGSAGSNTTLPSLTKIAEVTCDHK